MSTSYAAQLQAAAVKYGVPLNLLTAQIQAESSGNPLAVSPAGAQGLGQLMPTTAKALGVTDPYDPTQSIDAAARLDAQDHAATGNWADALRMYHGGTDRKNWGPKTQAYADKIMSQTVPSDAQWAAAMGASAPTATDAPTTGSAPSAPQGIPDDAAWTQAMSAPAPKKPGVLASLGAAAGKGFGDTVLTGQKLLGEGAQWVGNKLGAAPVQSAGNWLVGDADRGMANLEQQDAPYAAEHPGWTTAGDLAGQIGATALPLGAAGKLVGGGLEAAGAAAGDNLVGNALTGVSHLVDGSAGASARGLPKVLAKGASLAVRGAGAGAGFNALTGGNPIAGAEWGAAAGPAAGVAGKAVGVVASPVVRAVGNVLTDLSPEWTSRAAANKLVQAMTADGITPEQVVAKMRELGPDATPVDAASALVGAKAGGNVRNLAEVAANTPGEGQKLANQVFAQRMDTAPTRINDAVKAATGGTGGVHGEAADLMAARSAAARPLYEKALAGEIQPDARLQQFLNDPVFQAGLGRGQEIARLESLAKGEPFNPGEYASLSSAPATQVPSALVDAQGNPLSVMTVPGKAPMVSMRAADAAKRGLDDLLEGYRDPTTGRLVLDQRGRALNDVRNSFVDYLDQANPDYAAARAAWAGPSSSLDALNMGRRALSNDAEVTAANVGRLSPSDRQFFLSGVTRALQDKINAAQDGADVTRKIFGNKLIRDKLAAAFDNPDAFQQFERQMQAEEQYAATRNEVLKNSVSSRRLAGQVDQGNIYGPLLGAAKHVVTGNPGAAAANAAQASAELRNFLTQPSERQLAAQSRLLFTQNPDEFDGAFKKRPSVVKNFLLGR